ncbi:MAG TPA: ABC transporter permease [Vicinamibacterales bacterium]|nr:ABC transporter permease [Vicinamibacterales bacterium]
MTRLPRLRSFLSALLRRRRLEADMEAEWRAHLDTHVDALVAAGMSRDEATRRARKDFGDPLRWKEQAFEVRGVSWVNDLGADIRYGLRQMRRSPVFTATVMVTLAAGIGLNTAVFSVIDAVLLRSLDYPDPERVLWITGGNKQEFVGAVDFLAWKEQATSFDGLVAFDISDSALHTADTVVQTRVASVSDDFWAVSNARPMLGRLPLEREDAVLLAYPFYVRAFHADPMVVGGAVTLNGRQVTIAGVLPPGFRPQLTKPLASSGIPENVNDAYRTLTVPPPTKAPNGMITTRLVNVIGKLKAGLSVERAQADLEAIRRRTTTTNVGMPLPPALRMMPLRERIVGDATRPLIVLLAAAVFVFLIACANVAHLFLARASSRRSEVAIRASIGAGRWRLARQFFVESALIAAAGAIAGLVVARWSLATIVRILPYGVPRLQETTIDGRALAFAAAASIVAALVFGLVPVWSMWKDDARGVLKQALYGTLPIGSRLRTRATLVALEFALTIVLLVGAGLLIKSLWRLNALPDGFHPDRIVTMEVQFFGPSYREVDVRRTHVAEVLRRVSAVPGVSAAAMTTNAGFTVRLNREGDPFPPTPNDPTAAFARGTIASAGLAQVMGMRLVKGRWLTDSEPSPAWVINETFVRRHFGDSDPIGARFRYPGGKEAWATVVGVVADRKLQRLDAGAEPEFYIDYAHDLTFGYSIVASVAIDAATAAGQVRRTAAGVDAAVPVLEVRTLEAVLADSIAPYRFNLFTVGLFAAVALLLASVGIYGTLAYATSRRTQEIGIRLTLGAARGEVVAMVIRQGMTVALIGTLVGLVIGAGLPRMMRDLLYEVSPSDPYVFAVASAVLLLVGFAASLGPALRAASVQPLVALRHE